MNESKNHRTKRREASLTDGLFATQECRYGLLSFPRFDAYVGYSLQEYGEWAQIEIEMLLRFIENGAIVLDIGAFVGTHTVAFSRAAGSHGKVYALEPQPFVFALLKQNIEQNRLRNVTPLRAGAAARSGKMEVDLPDYASPANFAGVRLTPARATGPLEGTKSVEVVTVDSLGLKRCDLIKVDAEGMDLEVIRGAQETINTKRPFVFAECTNASERLGLGGLHARFSL